jgi:hypothetical protein
MEYFEIWLNSADAINGATTPHNCSFNLGNVNDFVPNAYIFANANYCYVKVKYFSVEETVTNFNTAGTGTILIEINGALPNSLRSNNIGTTNPRNTGLSDIIGVIPTGIGDNTYSSTTFDNDFVKSPNIFNGELNIRLKDQDNAPITLTVSKPWCMLLCVAFEKDIDLKNHPNTASTNYFSY